MQYNWTLPTDGVLKQLDDQTPVVYAVELKTPARVLGEAQQGDSYRITRHIFTANEIKRARARFRSETGTKLRRKIKPGYIGITTFTNQQGTLVTRYIVTLVEDTEGPSTMLFSPREFDRSIKRFNAIYPTGHMSLKEFFANVFKKKK